MTDHETLLAILRKELRPIFEPSKRRKAYRKIAIVDGRIEPTHKPQRITGEGVRRGDDVKPAKPENKRPAPRKGKGLPPPSKLNLAIARYLARPKRDTELEEINACRIAGGLQPLAELPEGL